MRALSGVAFRRAQANAKAAQTEFLQRRLHGTRPSEGGEQKVVCRVVALDEQAANELPIRERHVPPRMVPRERPGTVPQIGSRDEDPLVEIEPSAVGSLEDGESDREFPNARQRKQVVAAHRNAFAAREIDDGDAEQT